MKTIKLTKGMETIVDDSDYEWLSQWKWHYLKPIHNTSGYAFRSIHNGKPNQLAMHRQIMDAPNGFDVDHIDGNGLNNQRCNLRVCTRSENKRNVGKSKRNTSGYKGVTYHSKAKRWQVMIRANRKQIYIGQYLTAEEAAIAYDDAAKKYHGEYASLNFLNKLE